LYLEWRIGDSNS